MRRRGNKSNKVPNVKLRPAQEGALTRLRRRESPVLAEDSQLGSDDTGIVDLCPRPFKGLVLCATGVVDKPTLFKQALELGATSVNAFTDRVTHLVAEDHGGAKYNCAVERKVPILQPSWITESYQIWLRGDDVDLLDSIERHRLPIFSGVALCLSGITDIARQTQINKLLINNGGHYLKKLERPIRVTHLLCSGDEETDKMRYAEKFTSRGEANVHLVWEEWFWDSLEFGGRFDEERYYVRRPRPERKSLPETENSSSPPTIPPEKPKEANLLRQPESTPEDEAEEELASVKRLPAATLQLWGTLLGRRGYEISNGELVKSPSKGSQPSVPRQRSESPVAGNKSVISKFRRSNSFAPARPDASGAGLPQPFRRTRAPPSINTMGETSGTSISLAPPLVEKQAECSKLVAAATSGIFAGLKFVALGEAKSPSVRAAIESNGGGLIPESSEEDVHFIIVRLVSGSKLYRQEPDELRRVKYRTECWLERCVFEDRVCPPDDHITFVPLNAPIPILGAEKVYLSFSGLDQAEATWTTRLLRALGISLEKYFSRKTTHLLCPSATGPKFDKARQWGIPVVTMAWLTAIVNSGHIPTTSALSISGLRQNNWQGETTNAANDIKGKRKAVDTSEIRILDQEMHAAANAKDDNPHPLQSSKHAVEALVDSHITTSQRIPLMGLPLEQSGKSPILSKQQLPSTPRSDRLYFGKPTGALAGPSKLATVSTPSRTQSAPIIQATPRHHNSHPVSFSLPTTPSSNPARRPTPQEIERERRRARIPSSKSPSPLKIPQQPLNRFPTESPTRIPRDVAKALEDNITTLLGKRPSSEHEEPLPTAPPPGKRQRPQRPTRLQSRQSSDAQLYEAPAPSLLTDDESVNPFEPLDELNLLDVQMADNSIRVTYEDPRQQEETQRLMNLLNVGSKLPSGDSLDGKGSKGSLRTRKSTRIAGF